MGQARSKVRKRTPGSKTLAFLSVDGDGFEKGGTGTFMQVLFEAIRAACSSQSWSRGVELSRNGAVIGEQHNAAEYVFKVATRHGMAYMTVTLWPEDEDWICDCNSSDDACAHVAAAIIALRRARQDGKAMPKPNALPGHVAYHIQCCERRLTLQRMVVQKDASQPLAHSLAALATGQVTGPTVAITQADLNVERVIGRRQDGQIPREMMPKLLSSLARCSDVRLDQKPIKTSGTPVYPRILVTDHQHGFCVHLEPDPQITEVFHNGALLCGDALRPVGESGLTARERLDLQEGRLFSFEGVAELLTEVLPALRKRLPVHIQTQRLPDTTAVAPHMRLDLEDEDGALRVKPTIVYGEPPIAQVTDGRLVHLQGTVPIRDTGAERRLARDLMAGFGLKPDQPVRFAAEDAVRFVQRLSTWRGEIRGQAHHVYRLLPALQPHLQLDPDHFALQFDCPAVGGQTARHVDPARVLNAWTDGAAMLALPGGGWAPLPIDWLERFGHRVADLLAARDATGSLPACVIPDLVRLCHSMEQPPPPEFAALQGVVDDFDGIPAAPLPPHVQGTLRAYQQRGVDWLRFLRTAQLGALLADDMGLGKTLQALCGLEGKTLVVAPTSVLHNWAHEIERFRPNLQYSIYHGPQRQLDPAVDVTLTTYAILRLDADLLAQQQWDSVVLDEAQTIKNPDSQVAQAAYRLQASFRMALSGTPVENRLDDLWSQMHFLNRGLLGSRDHFQTHYARPIAAGKAGAATRLQERIRPFVLRRRKQDVAIELPPRTDAILHCVLSDSERQVYDAIRAATREHVVARLERGGNVLEALEALLRLRQACCHMDLVPGQQADSSAKIEVLLEALDQITAEGHKALVFSQWTALLDRIEPHLRSAGLPFTRLDGSTRDRAAVVQRFQDEEGPPVMLISLRAGGLGLNLTAADHVFLLDPWWNPAVEEQAADRTHRIGQQRPVMVYRLVAEDTVEERILALQEHKRSLADAALGSATQAEGLTRDDLLALLTD